ncbi:succinylglutamate desuccinylase/aspartoacylase domain-containing protein [Sinorhizobium medicae]|uniref:succinylglutamate desuccinylase/aspartoacylase domain-containing protein n=1 Tax=Sinorhizobium medicae TaxID=110321 RepID=UPI001297DB45|nr:succinylglutamate desuccinylase/aspartoacylase family protein [Sinorhizobium medicae]MDX0967869.1 succinylglutamate desuccinylase [Sinorhizobium medicae]MQV49886.1 succinylglutamate desuccinylase [Sinorhizobium medicae]MQV55671.1 succinylglutamate desuccinylase [Sinorhizobium medicae]MQV75336.1 succinylglutamate desuccinylase [Sinorhizobium medicae]WQO88508.1 succinylglutamate desuccinylase/aspartoacylase family protein [Sinorhizobium medicae]
MRTVCALKSVEYGQPGIFRGHVSFSNPVLAPYSWPLCEVRGATPGPKLCVSAGVHVNEVAAIEAAVRLQKLFDPDHIRGTVSIIPLINQPALYKYSEYVCPIDEKNINFSFPGSSRGTFSDCLCDAIMSEWCIDADCYIDMHGGDLRERVSHFTIYQQTSDTSLNRLARQMAMCFDAELVVGLPTSHLSKPGRPPTGFAAKQRLALMSEAGSNGLLSEDAIEFHVEGVLNVARSLNILDTKMTEFRRARVSCNDYLWVTTPADGEFHATVEPGARVEKNQSVGTIRDFFGETIAEIVAPQAGWLLWRITQPSVPSGSSVLAIAVEEDQPTMAGP